MKICFFEPLVKNKISQIDQCIEKAMRGEVIDFSKPPARDIQVLDPKFHPNKKGLASREGQIRLLHDLASIELQAMEMGLRTLFEFPELSESYRQELALIVRSEAEHLQLCLKGLEDLGAQWGDFPVHLALWNALSSEDSLIDRVLIVHRYLEGSGLDAGDMFLKRMQSVDSPVLYPIVKRINDEEVGHVEFGSRLYRDLCLEYKVDSDQDFKQRMAKLRYRIPKRVENISQELRLKSGFSESEIETLMDLRKSFLEKKGHSAKN